MLYVDCRERYLLLDEITQKHIRYLFLIFVNSVSTLLQFCKQLFRVRPFIHYHYHYHLTPLLLSFKSFLEIQTG